MDFRTPEQMGISSRHVLNFYKELDYWHLSTHAVILSRGDHFFSECYYAPFHKDFEHRMYSTTKSFASIAIGFAEQDGLLSLDDPLDKFFPEYKNRTYSHETTIRQMLQMRTKMDTSGTGIGWFKVHEGDRAGYYFDKEPLKYPDTLFYYDSNGSFMLAAVVEQVTGMPFFDYLKKKVLNGIGFSQNSTCLKCPGGHSWADSGILCTARDLWLFARFVLNGGTWNGKRYLNGQYVKDATTPAVPNNPYGFGDMHDMHGYGYQFWGAPKGCFATLGMGNQISLCDPKHDFICVINSDNQGNSNAYEQIFRAIYSNLIDHLGDPLPEDPEALAELNEYLATRKLFTLYESPTSPFAEKIAGKTFRCAQNKAGWKWFRLEFSGQTGTVFFENEQGEKQMTFGFGHNEFAKFPQSGYSDEIGGVPAPGNYYDAAFSADWPAERTLRVRVQIIDKYFANLSLVFGFADENTVTLRMTKAAEDFLDEYKGLVNAKAE